MTITRGTDRGRLGREVRVGGRLLARLRPAGPGAVPRAAALAPGQPVKLSRFAIIRAEHGRLVAQAPLSPAEVEIAPVACGLLGALAEWTTPAAITDLVTPGLTAAAVAAILPLLADAQLLAPGGPGEDAECDTLAQGQWKPADLWLHARSRGPLLSASYGVYPAEARRFEPLPARTEPDPGRVFQLTVPDAGAVAKADPGLTQAIEARRSIREQDGAAPLTAAQLGELLYRTARQRGSYRAPSGLEAADRPYPSGGASHELEIYPLVTSCAGLEPGLWHYRPDDHQLRLVAPASPATRRMIANARASCLMDADPQVLLVITARFGRVMWKYDGLAYSLILKHVGVYMQTAYLVATAMGLAVCGVGGGDATDFATASGLDYYAQGSVGEMVLGSPR